MLPVETYVVAGSSRDVELREPVVVSSLVPALPPIPCARGYRGPVNSYDLHPKDINKLRKASNPFYYLPWSFKAFSKLRGRDPVTDILWLPKKIPVELSPVQLSTTGNPLPIGWQFDARLQESWNALENVLIWLLNCLRDAYKALIGDMCLPPQHALFPLPSSYGFTSGRFRTPGAVRRAVIRSRCAFFALTALVSFMVAKFEYDCRAMDPSRTWRDNIAEATARVLSATQDAALQVVLRSVVTSLPGTGHLRVGVVMHRDCDWWDLVPMMIRYGIPVYVEWGPVSGITALRDYTIAPAWSKYAVPPSDHEIQAALDEFTPAYDAYCRAERRKIAEQDPETRRGFPSLPAAQDLWHGTHKPETSSRQQQDEGPIAFFTRQERERQLAIEHESDIHRSNREVTAVAYADYPCPTGPVPAVWTWTRDVRGLWIRTRVSFHRVAEIWDAVPNEWKRYDWREREWDFWAGPHDIEEDIEPVPSDYEGDGTDGDPTEGDSDDEENSPRYGMETQADPFGPPMPMEHTKSALDDIGRSELLRAYVDLAKDRPDPFGDCLARSNTLERIRDRLVHSADKHTHGDLTVRQPTDTVSAQKLAYPENGLSCRTPSSITQSKNSCSLSTKGMYWRPFHTRSVDRSFISSALSFRSGIFLSSGPSPLRQSPFPRTLRYASSC